MKRPFAVIATRLIALGSLGATVACIPPEVDSLVTIEAPRPMIRFRIAKHLRESKLWRVYLEQLASEAGRSEPVVSIDVAFERRVTDDRGTGDYDPGVVTMDLEVTELFEGSVLLSESDELEIPDYVIVDETANRDEVQDAAFEAVEDKAVYQILHSIDLALIRAMGREPSRAEAFIPVLENLQERHWSVGLKREAQQALDSLRRSGR